MEQAFNIGLTVAWPVAIACIVIAIINYVIARQIGSSREVVRTLRVALEHNPSPAQLGECLRMWPDLAQFPQSLQLGEMIQRSMKEEGRRAERVEKMLGLCRTFLIIALLPIALIVTSYFWTPT